MNKFRGFVVRLAWVTLAAVCVALLVAAMPGNSWAQQIMRAVQSGTWILGANSGVDIGDVTLTASANNIGDVDVLSMPADATELPAPANLADNTGNPTVTSIAAYLMCFDGTNWDRCQVTSDVAEDAAETAGGSGPMVINVRRDVAASSSTTTGDNSTFNTDALGLLWSRQLDPCSGVAKTYIPIDIVTATTTEITAALAGASTHYYICSINLVTAAANNVALVDDDTDNCASVTSGVMGGVTAGEGWTLAANGGLSLGNGFSSVARTVGTNRVLCIVTSAATQLSGGLTVAAAP